MSAATTIFICDSCGEAFGKKASLKKHREKRHPRGARLRRQGKFECPICRSQLSGMRGLHRHVVKCSANREPEESDSEQGGSEDSDRYDDNEDFGETAVGDNGKCVHTAKREGASNFKDSLHPQWRVAVCTRCQYIVDPQNIVSHILVVHKLDVADIDRVRRTIAASNLRPHLADDDSGDEDNAGFLPGSAAVKGLPVYAGLKCMICLGVFMIELLCDHSYLTSKLQKLNNLGPEVPEPKHRQKST
ncbi:hypothetical protein V1506DRAFT_569353 [Lipomyces tetrasporus]